VHHWSFPGPRELAGSFARLAAVPTSHRIRTVRTPAFALALVATLTLALSACAGASAPQLAGKDYVAAKVTDGGRDRPLVAGTKLRLSFTATDLGASAGCNHMSAPYRVDNNRLIVGSLATTDMGCEPDLMAQDQWYGELLGATPAISLAGSELILEVGSVRIAFTDREVAEPDAKLVGPTWRVDGVITGDAVSSVPAEPVATLVFRADGTIEVNSGCNRGSGTWSSVPGGIDVGPLLLTKMACQKDPATLESAVLGVLEADSIAAAIDGSRLTLQAGGRGLILRAT
jgi:heat shock protein HslJ